MLVALTTTTLVSDGPHPTVSVVVLSVIVADIGYRAMKPNEASNVGPVD